MEGKMKTKNGSISHCGGLMILATDRAGGLWVKYPSFPAKQGELLSDLGS
jgi:hypothetical protein